jgi:hypothetical protein
MKATQQLHGLVMIGTSEDSKFVAWTLAHQSSHHSDTAHLHRSFE